MTFKHLNWSSNRF